MWEITFTDGTEEHKGILWIDDDDESLAVLEIPACPDEYPNRAQHIIFQNKAICTSIGELGDWNSILRFGDVIVDVEFATSVAIDILNKGQ